jgi:hypothetical protein
VPERIIVEGLDELRKALKALGDMDSTKEFKAAGYTIMERVAAEAKGRAAGLGRMQARAGASIKPARVATGGAVRFGGGVPWAMGSEFGAGQGVPRNTARGTVAGWNQFMPWRGSGGGAGYFLWPTVRDRAKTIAADYDKLLEPLYHRLFPQ